MTEKSIADRELDYADALPVLITISTAVSVIVVEDSKPVPDAHLKEGIAAWGAIYCIALVSALFTRGRLGTPTWLGPCMLAITPVLVALYMSADNKLWRATMSFASCFYTIRCWTITGFRE